MLSAGSGERDALVVGARGYVPVPRVLPGTVGAKVLHAPPARPRLPPCAPEERGTSVVGITGAGSAPAR
jgi:hypothetical protein